ncbi:hypothetical protein F5Y01DRAFT_274242 [Xylaria sp. FL0043]|nr:hypothetical protein F5Y01DRAFT_274242 [Xylaria sp. FL0043]
MAVHKRMALGGASNLTTSSQQGSSANAFFQAGARTRNTDTGTTKMYRRKVMKCADAPLARHRLLPSALCLKSAHLTSHARQGSPHPPPPPHPPVPNPPPPNGRHICWC